MSKVLIACEFSGRVREAFRKKGHDAWSCDLLPADDGSKYHIQGDVLEILNDGWDMMIAHPPCTYLTNSGVTWLYRDGDRWKDLIDGAVFFRTLWQADIPLIAVENPIMHKYAKQIIGGTQTQVIQPYMFGHAERKATTLWLKGLPKLQPTNNVYDEMMELPKNVRERLHYLPPSKDRWKLRSMTYQGIADAMSEQWGNDLVAPSSEPTLTYTKSELSKLIEAEVRDALARQATPTASGKQVAKPSEGLAKLHKLSKDIRISQLEGQLKTVHDFAQLMSELKEELQ